MSGEYQADGCSVVFNGPGPAPTSIADANTPGWARHIATALNEWARSEAADPLGVKCPEFGCERPSGRRCKAIGTQGGMDGPPHRRRKELAAKAKREAV